MKRLIPFFSLLFLTQLKHWSILGGASWILLALVKSIGNRDLLETVSALLMYLGVILFFGHNVLISMNRSWIVSLPVKKQTLLWIPSLVWISSGLMGTIVLYALGTHYALLDVKDVSPTNGIQSSMELGAAILMVVFCIVLIGYPLFTLSTSFLGRGGQRIGQSHTQLKSKSQFVGIAALAIVLISLLPLTVAKMYSLTKLGVLSLTVIPFALIWLRAGKNLGLGKIASRKIFILYGSPTVIIPILVYIGFLLSAYSTSLTARINSRNWLGVLGPKIMESDLVAAIIQTEHNADEGLSEYVELYRNRFKNGKKVVAGEGQFTFKSVLESKKTRSALLAASNLFDFGTYSLSEGDVFYHEISRVIKPDDVDDCTIAGWLSSKMDEKDVIEYLRSTDPWHQRIGLIRARYESKPAYLDTILRNYEIYSGFTRERADMTLRLLTGKEVGPSGARGLASATLRQMDCSTFSLKPDQDENTVDLPLLNTCVRRWAFSSAEKRFNIERLGYLDYSLRGKSRNWLRSNFIQAK